ncbi:MAG: potassium/proton antiporter [Burkholderiales bacterium]|nr:potassium/proton antiporter [Burkholderiales bacterium]
MDQANQLILIGAGLVAVSILASVFAARSGTPLLLVFLVLGMLAGEDGPGGIIFNDTQTAYLIGSTALGIILFDGGMRTKRDSVRVVLWPGLVLSTLGVVITAAVVAAFSVWLFNFNWLEGFLLGAIIGSTDAAAVFFMLNARGLALKRRVGAVLELESGSNDPMAIFLTIILLEALVAGKTSLDWTVFRDLTSQFGIGAAGGIAGGALMVWLLNRLDLATSLYPLLASALALLTFAVTTALGGSGFLAIYIAGLVLGNRQVQSAQNILRMHDGMAWLAQISMFLILGLLVTPSELPPIAGVSILIAVVLIFVARPLAVLVCLLPFRFPWREQTYIGWIGLRGAVPIILGIFPLLAGLDNAKLFFNIAFFVVLLSLLVQGWTVAGAARLLQLEVPPDSAPVHRFDLDIRGHWDFELLRYDLTENSPVLRHDLSRLPLPEQTSIAAVVRNDRLESHKQLQTLKPGDHVYVIASAKHVSPLNRLFIAPDSPDRLEEHRFFGDLVLDGDANLKDVVEFYGLELSTDSAADITLAGYLHGIFHKRPVVGDRIRLGRVELVVREMNDNKISRIGLKFRRSEQTS